MDAVILAGGKGSRLDGVMPPYWKPLMPVNAVPLINRIIGQVEAQDIIRTFIVVAPENALQISQVIPPTSHAILVVQRFATGPGDALSLALSLSQENEALVVMGDNLMPDTDVQAVCAARKASSFVIGTGTVETASEAARFTRIYDEGRIIEEGPNVSWPGRSPFTVWCGPLILPVDDALEAIRRTEDVGEKKIGTHLQYVEHQPVLVPCSAVDIGTPASLMEVQQ